MGGSFFLLISARALIRTELESGRGEDGMQSAWNDCALDAPNFLQIGRMGLRISSPGCGNWIVGIFVPIEVRGLPGRQTQGAGAPSGWFLSVETGATCHIPSDRGENKGFTT